MTTKLGLALYIILGVLVLLFVAGVFWVTGGMREMRRTSAPYVYRRDR